MESERQVPCLIICSGGTPWEISQEAPALLKAWKVSAGEILSASEAFFKCLRATESVRGTKPLFFGTRKSGS